MIKSWRDDPRSNTQYDDQAAGLRRWVRTVMPHLEQAGRRRADTVKL